MEEKSDLVLHCLPKSDCQKIKDYIKGIFEPRCGKTGFLHMRKQRRRSASR